MSRRPVRTAGWVTILAGFVLMAVHYFGGTSGDPEGWFSAVGFGAPISGAGGLALVGEWRNKPALCLAGGTALAIISVVSVVMLPLVIAAAFMVSGARGDSIDLRSFAVSMVFAAGLVAVFAILVFHEDPVTWSTPQGGGASSDIVTNLEAAVSLVVVATVLGGSVVWSERTAR